MGAHVEPDNPPGRLQRRAVATDNARVSPEQTPALVGGFTVLEELGRGAAAQVFRVRRAEGANGANGAHPADVADYALKLLAPDAEDPETRAAELRREAALLAGVPHPGLPGIHEVGEHAGRPYLVMDLVAGRTLSEVLATGPMPARGVVALARDLAGPLAAIHRRGLAHRDLKPSNIMVLPDGRARLIDFGLAARWSDRTSSAVVGTIIYAAPEQTGMLRRPPDHRCDLYSLGVVLFECLAGRPPFTAVEPGELLRLHAGAPVPDLRELAPDVPEGLAVLVETLLAKDPDDRYDDAVAVLDDLDRLSAAPADAPFVAQPAVPRWTAVARRQTLVGRSAELHRLLARWTAAQQGTGGVWLVTGPAGSGKSALAAALAAHVETAGSLVLHGRGDADDPVPLAPLREALAAHLAELDRLPAARRDTGRAELVRAAGADADVVSGLATALPRLLGTASPRTAAAGQAVDSGSGGAAHVDPERFDQAVADLLAGLATAHGGALLVVDDAQWVDPGTRRVLARLAPQLDDVPLLVLLLARNGGAPSLPLPGLPDEPALTLGPLPDPAVADLLRTALPGADSDDRTIELFTARSSGNPLVALEYLNAVVDAGLLRPHWGSWLLDEEGLAALALPQDAVGLVLARLHHLPPTTRDLLVTAGVIGMRFCGPLLAEAHGLDLADVVGELHLAAAHGLVEPLGEGGFGFVHDALRGELLADLDPDEIARRHRAAADAYRAEPVPADGYPAEHVFALARHDLAGGIERAPRRAFEELRQAGRLALTANAPEQAVEFLRGAIALTPDVVDDVVEGGGRSRLALMLGIALHRSGAFDEATAVLQEALAAAPPDALLRAEVLAELAEVHRSGGRLAPALETVREALAELGAPLPPAGPRLLADSLWRYLLSRLSRWTGVRYGHARGAELQRCRMIVRLHGIAGFVAVLDAALDQVTMFALRLPYWADRIGPGREYLAAEVSLGYLFMGIGRARKAERIFARLRHDPAWTDPSVRAMALDAEAGAYFFFDRDDGEAASDALLTHGRWLDTGVFRDGCDALTLHHATAGRSRVAQQWHERARRRVALAGHGARTPLHALTSAMMEAVQGRPAVAARRLRDIERDLPIPCPTGIVTVHRLAQLVVLREQDETGEPFDTAVTAFASLRLAPRTLLRIHRVVYFHIAMGRLAQARRASGTERAERLAQAEDALRQLRRFRGDADLRALERVARADLRLQRGDPRGALQTLAELDPADRHDVPVPVAEYEGARVRARALAALGSSDEAGRQARFALDVAEDEGWPHRAAWVTGEFGAAAGRRARGSGAASSGSVSWTTAPSAHGSDELLTGLTSRAGDAQGHLLRQRLQALQQVSLAASRVVDPSALARISLDHTIRILGAERAYLFLTDEYEHLVPFLGRACDGTDLTELTGHSASLVERVHREGTPLVVTGTEEGAALGAESVVLHGLRSIVIAPLQLEQRRLGVVYLDSQVAKGIFSTDDLDILTALTTHIATSLETARAAQLAISVQTARRERDLAERLREASQSFAEAATPELVLAGLLDWAVRLTRSEAGWIVLRGPDGDRLHGAAAPPAGRPVTADGPLDALLTADGPVVGTPDAVPAELQEELADALGTGGWIGLPLRSGELTAGALILRRAPDRGVAASGVAASGDAASRDAASGVVAASGDAASGDAASRDAASRDAANAVDVGRALVAQAAVAYDRATLFARVQALAVADELTGIANRRHFFEVARRDVRTSQRAGRPLAVAMVDIDRFKVVNDTYGHPTGDDVIRTVAQRLTAGLRSTDLLGRYGGEEFAIVLLDVLDPLQLAEGIRAAIAGSPVPTRSGPLEVTVSVGVAELDPGDDLESVLARADRALYRAKVEGRDRVCVDIASVRAGSGDSRS